MAEPRGLIRSRLALILFCLAPAAPAVTSHALADEAAATRPPVDIPRATGPIKVDGVLDEPAWASALELHIPFEVSPADNIPARVLTDVRLTYDDSGFYLAFVAHDPDPDRIRARISDRDTAFQDDFVGVALDTFNDGRRGFEFFVNPLGVQMDLTIDDLGNGEDESWDAIWDSAGRLTPDGYVVEMSLPYTSLRFQRGGGSQIWGLDLVRVYPRDRRYILGMNRRDPKISCYLCQIGKVSGFEGAEPGLNLEVTPTLTATRTDTTPTEQDAGVAVGPDYAGDRYIGEGLVHGDPDYELGVTGRWGMTPNLTLSGTINPDFSQVEADAAQLDVNEQFNLFYPEKRPFFLEGADFFTTPIQAVYTRTVSDPSWGVKLTGKEGRNAIGAFVSRDDQTNLIFPGSQGSSSGSIADQSTVGVFRYRRDIGKSSAIGGLVTVREGDTDREGDGYHNRVAGIDTLLHPAKPDTLRFQALVSQTRYPGSIAEDPDLGQPSGDFAGHAIEASYTHEIREWSVWTNYEDISADFRADLGFVPQVDYRKPHVGYEYRWWGDPNDWYLRFEAGGNYGETHDQSGTLIVKELETWYTFRGAAQSYARLTLGRDVSAYRAAVFQQPYWDVRTNFQPGDDVEVGFTYERGNKVDYSYVDPNHAMTAREGRGTRITQYLDYRPGRHVTMNLNTEIRRLDGSGGRFFRASQAELRVVYQINVRTFVRAILQYQTLKRDLTLYPACDPNQPPCDLAAESNDLFTQLLFSYKVNPQTAVFVGYSDARAGDIDTPLTLTDRTYFFKVGYAWVR